MAYDFFKDDGTNFEVQADDGCYAPFGRVVSLARGSNHANPTVVSRSRGGGFVGRAGDCGACRPG